MKNNFDLYDSFHKFWERIFFFFLWNINEQGWCNLARNNQRVYNYDAKISPVIPIGWKSADTTSNGSANWINSGNKKAANDYYKARLASRFIWSPSLIGFSIPWSKNYLYMYIQEVFYTVCDMIIYNYEFHKLVINIHSQVIFEISRIKNKL